VGVGPEEIFIPDGSATFQLELPATPSEADYENVSLDIDALNYSNTTVQKIFLAWLYNWETGDWDEFEAKLGTTPLPDPAVYISGEGMVRVRIAPANTAGISSKGLSLRGISLGAEGRMKPQ
jgi:hypothetical protein